MRKYFKALDAFLSKHEKKGHETANRLHRYAINSILLVMGYNIYTIFAGYNQSLLNVRKAKATDALAEDYERRMQAQAEVEAMARGDRG